jgi:hypothetical protein
MHQLELWRGLCRPSLSELDEKSEVTGSSANRYGGCNFFAILQLRRGRDICHLMGTLIEAQSDSALAQPSSSNDWCREQTYAQANGLQAQSTHSGRPILKSSDRYFVNGKLEQTPS